MNKYLLLFILLFISTASLNANTLADSLFVNLKSGESLSPHSIQLKFPVLKNPYMLVNNVKRVDLNFIKSYQDETGFYLNSKVDNIKTEFLLKRIEEGKISAYSRSVSNPGSYSPSGVLTGGGKSTAFYLQKANGKILTLNYENAKNAMSDNKVYLNKLKAVNTIKNLSIVGYALGGGLILMGTIQTLAGDDSQYPSQNSKTSPLLYAGAAMFSIPLLFNHKTDKKLLSAIKIYNGQ